MNIAENPKVPRYGRGKFTAHPDYVKYMQMIVDNPNYATMPNKTSANGKINWQVSSGKTTSFYKFYLERFQWWVDKADDLGVRGSGNSEDRFSKTARLIHPTKLRVCRLCGKKRSVGYFYINQVLANKLNKISGTDLFVKATPVNQALVKIEEFLSPQQLSSLLNELFPERLELIQAKGLEAAFRVTVEIRSKYLSPGFMCNPPDRLDGFHDYCIYCREKNDPGRSRANLTSYVHDRRVFELWSEGDWFVADHLYSSAGAGTCKICGKEVAKISPDHIGPLACGFQQMPLFNPLCGPCNSSKNRRMSLSDISDLLEYEAKTGQSVASWQVRAMWDARKQTVKNDSEAKELSDEMRAVQDLYIRTLHELKKAGCAGMLVRFLHPEYALFSVEFKKLDPSTLTYESFQKSPLTSKLRKSLSARIVRIAFEELDLYALKDLKDRKVRKQFHEEYQAEITELVDRAKQHHSDEYLIAWDNALKQDSKDAIQAAIAELQDKEITDQYSAFETTIRGMFAKIK